MSKDNRNSQLEHALDFVVFGNKDDSQEKDEAIKEVIIESNPETPNGLSSDSIKNEIKREKYKKRYHSALRSTVMVLAVVAAVAILIANTWLPVMQIYGVSMTPTVSEGEIIVAVKGSDFETGDIVSLWYGNNLLVKRVIAGPGQWVDISSDGTVSVDDVILDEPYVNDKALGDCNIKLPYQVPEGKYFVMGDHRSTSQDSRNSIVGCIPREQIVGKVYFRVWPYDRIGRVNK